jgi:hypothetical protein
MPDRVPAVALFTVIDPELSAAVVMLPVPDTAPVVDVSVVVLLVPKVLMAAPILRPTPGVTFVRSPVKPM